MPETKWYKGRSSGQFYLGSSERLAMLSVCVLRQSVSSAVSILNNNALVRRRPILLEHGHEVRFVPGCQLPYSGISCKETNRKMDDVPNCVAFVFVEAIGLAMGDGRIRINRRKQASNVNQHGESSSTG